MFSFLEGISPFWWAAFGLAIGVIEMLLQSYFLVWPALAAFAMIAVLLAVPELAGNLQATTYVCLSVVLTIAGRYAVSRWERKDRRDDGLNDIASRMVGRKARVVSYDGSIGQAEIDGTLWRVRSADGRSDRPGEFVQIIGAEGAVLIYEESGSSASR